MSYFSKLLTMMGRGRDIVSAPLTAVMLPTSFPSPEIGKISPYLGNKDETAVYGETRVYSYLMITLLYRNI